MKKIIGVGVALAVSSVAWAGETVWTGAADAFWTNAVNWTAGVPGVTDTAKFDATGASGATTVNLDGAGLLQRLVITGAECPKYVFGTSSAQTLRLPAIASPTDTGYGILIDASVPSANVPELVATLGGECRVANYCYQRIENNSSGTFAMNDFGDYTADAAVNVSGKTTYPEPCFFGAGPIEIRGVCVKATWPERVCGITTELGLRGTGNVKVCKSLSVNRLFGEGDGTIVRSLEIPAGVMLSFTGSGFQWIGRSQMHIYGGGTLGFYAGTGATFENSLGAATYSHVVDVAVTNLYGTAKAVGIRYYGAGVQCYNHPDNDLGGPLQLYSSSASLFLTIAAPKFGKKGEPSCVGRAVDSFLCVRNAAIRYIGTESDETDRDIVFANKSGWTPWNSKARIDQCGSGTFTYSGTFSSQDGAQSADLVLAGTGTADGILTSTLADQPDYDLTLTKQESCRWVLTGASTHTGATTVEAGTLALGAGGSIESTPVVLKGGTFAVTAAEAKALRSVAVQGISVIALADGATLSVGDLTHTEGLLDVQLGEGSALTCPALAGTAPGWLTVGGFPGEFDSQGRVGKSTIKVTDEIAARGGVITNGAEKAVGITTDGDPDAGPITLEKPATTIDMLAQKTETPATVSLADGGTLTTKSIMVAEGKAGVTIGAEPGEGALAAPSGSQMVIDNAGTGAITVNAAVSLPAGALARHGDIRFAGEALAASAGTIELVNDAKVAITNDTTFTGGPTFTGGAAGVNMVSYEGPGTFIPSVDQSTYTGDWEVRSGATVVFNDDNGAADVSKYFGKGGSGGCLYVRDGATLVSEGSANSSRTFASTGRTVHLAGIGVNGEGAAIAREYYPGLFHNVVLDGDTRFATTKGPVNWGYMCFTGSYTMDMQGHDMEKIGAGNFTFFQGYRLLNPGRIFLRQPTDGSTAEGNLQFYVGADLGICDKPIVLEGRTGITSYSANPLGRPIVVNVTNATLYAKLTAINSASGLDIDKCNMFTGGVTFAESNAGNLKVFANAGRWLTVDGPITGPGGIVLPNEGGNADRFAIMGRGNTFTGGVSVYGGGGGYLYLNHPDSVPDYSKVTLSTRARAMVNPANWTGAEIADLARRATIDASSYVLVGAGGGQKSAAVDYTDGTVPDTLTSLPIVVEDGTFDTVYTGAWSKSVQLAVGGGRHEFTGPGEMTFGGDGNVKPGPTGKDPAELVFDKGVNVTLAGGHKRWGYLGDGVTTHEPFRVVISNATVRAADDWTTWTDWHLAIGSNYAQTEMLIGEGAVFESNFELGLFGGHGYIAQTGGEVKALSGTTWATYSWIGGNGGTRDSGCYEIFGGTFTAPSNLYIGAAPYGASSFLVRGGESYVNTMQVGHSSQKAELVVSGGSIHFADLSVPRNGQEVVGTRSDMTIEGGFACVSNALPAGGGSARNCAVFNLLGGVLQVPSISRVGYASWMSDWESNSVEVNFNGGTIRPLLNNSSLFPTGNAGSNAVAHVTVHAGGAFVDVPADMKAGHGVPFTAPTGLGVASVPMVGDAVFTNVLVTPPSVRIIGKGSGAAALCEIDRATHRATRIRITAPGRDYVDDGSTKAEINYGTIAAGVYAIVTNDCVLTDTTPVSGGLVKTGAGTFELAAGNTYAGATIVSNGTLKAMSATSLPARGEIRLCRGGLLDMNGFAVPECATVVLDDPSDVVKAAKRVTLLRNCDGDVTVANAGELAAFGWEVRSAAGRVYAHKLTGTAILIR